MDQVLDVGRGVYVDRDQQGTVRALRHFDSPFRTTARTPALVAADYLHSFADLLGIPPTQLASLGESPSRAPVKADVEFRFGGEKTQFDTTTVAFEQTVLGLPVFGAGLSVTLQGSDMRCVSSNTTQHPDVAVRRPSAEAIKKAESITPAALAASLGLPRATNGAAARRAIEIRDRRLVVYRYDPAAVQRDDPPVILERVGTPNADGVTVSGPEGSASLPVLPLPAVPDSIRAEQHYVCVRLDFELTLPDWGALNWTAILDVETLTTLYVRPHVDDVTGLVFDVEPVTTNGGPGPSSPASALNPVRVSRALQGLAAPVNGTQALAGDTVTLVDTETPTIASPTLPTGSNFDFDARTDGFSAVNAYVHCDSFFRLVDGMGLTRPSYFSGTTFPSSVDHRGNVSGGSGIEVNAHCLGTSGGAGILRTTFALADIGDTTHPIGLADDFRVVLHELGGHGVLYNHVHSANFGFAHSAGDSIAAILNDPGSQAPDRFVTFPWVGAIGRRHDRLPSGGWGWSGDIALHPFDGTRDRGGYNNEQILSSTMFRIYRSLGGDSSDLTTQRFAARMTVYLILRAIGTLTPSTNPGTATGFETALETADAGDWTTENLTGGAYRKVIRWAFEKQGMFQPAGTSTPNNNAGAPPAVDVYIEDGRHGEYQYQPVFWDNQSIWNRRASDGGSTHEDPVTNRTNYAYVKIKNRGTSAATGVVVRAYHANPAAGLSFPNDWMPMTTTQLSAPNVPANNSGEVIVGPFAWTPTHVGHECMFMIVSASGDESNVSHIAAGDAIPEWRLVPHDNNIGQRNVAPVPGGTTGLVEEFDQLSFLVKNPLTRRASVLLEAVLPSMLRERDWSLAFASAGGNSFALEPGESRDVVMRLTRGKDFTPSDVEAAGDPAIAVQARMDGIVVGGMTYRLDPTLDRPNRPHGGPNPAPGEPGHRHDDQCGCDRDDAKLDRMTELLLDALASRPQRVREVEVKKVILEIELEDC